MYNRLLILIIIILFSQKLIAIYFTNFNLFGDEAQYWLWSKELDYGYFSKPPFLAWAIAVYTNIFGDSFFSLKLLPSIVYFFIAWAIFNLCKNIGLKKNNSLSCSLLFLLIPAVSYSSFLISTDIFLLLFWTLALNELVIIKESQKFKNFLMLGVFIGLAFLSKYAAIYFIICLLIYVLLDKKFRTLFIKNYLGFIFSFLCLFVIILQNIIWNLNNSWITLQHTSDNANFNNIKISFFRGIEFLVIQILMLGPLLFVGSLFNYNKNILDDKQKLLLFFSIPIFLIVLIEAIIVRANANWAAPGLISFFIFLYLVTKNNLIQKLNFGFNFVFCALFFLLIGTNYQTNAFNRISGISEFSETVHVLGSNIGVEDFVISDRLLFANLKYEMRNKQKNFHMPHRPGDRITNHFKMKSALKKEIKRNFIFIGNPNEINYLDNDYKINKLKSIDNKFTNKKINVYEVLFN